ncbi:hypothetical protein, partial [Mycobacterium sp. P7213]|uniref:hypothetical protein n=1 Tax=Mycobacterium sp. P7213 TaxID=2478465 RepID=UPI0013DDE98B
MTGKQHRAERRGITGAVRRRSGRVAAAGSAVGAFLAFGLSPLSSAPVAHADELDWVVDLVGSDLAGALGDLSQASSWETLFDQASWEPLLSNVGLSFDASLAGVPGSAA